MNLSRQLERDLDWRTAELAELKKIAISVSERELAYNATLRALWVMLYAHYEGFCKFAISLLLETIEKTKKARHLFRDEIIIFSLEDEFKILRKNSSAKFCYEYFQRSFQEILQSEIQFKKDKKEEYVIKGSSNLYPDDLREMCNCICISEKEIENNEMKLKALVSRRNEIAHGREHPVQNLDDYQQYENAAIDVMISLALAIMGAFEQQVYLRK